MKLFLKTLLNYIIAHKLDFAIVLISLFLISSSIILFGYIFKQCIDLGIHKNDISTINVYLSYLCILILVFGCASFIRSFYINHISQQITNKIRTDAFNNLIAREVAFFETLQVGDLISRLSADLEIISKTIVNFLSFFIRNLMMAIGGMLMMFVQSFQLSMIAFVLIASIMLALSKFSKNIRILSSKCTSVHGLLFQVIEESFLNINTIKAYNKEASQIELFQNQTDSYSKLASRRLFLRAMFFSSAISAIMICIVIVIWVGSRSMMSDMMTAGGLLSFTYYAIITGMSGSGIAELFSELDASISSIERVSILVQNVHDHNKNAIDASVVGAKNDSQILVHQEYMLSNLGLVKHQFIEFEDIVFAYPTRPDIQIFDNLSMKIPLKSFIGVVGRSGIGKSTIFQLLLKFYHIKSGVIRIDSRDISEISSDEIRQKMGYVSQAPGIFSGTLRSNIMFAKPSATKAELDEALFISGIDNFIGTLGQGIDTEIGMMGVNLSSGQCQRIGIARAVLYNPEIMLLDEATSALDSDSENLILAKLRSKMSHRTVISIAHRVSSIENADQIILIDSKNAIDIGTHLELIHNSIMYKKLCEEQHFVVN